MNFWSNTTFNAKLFLPNKEVRRVRLPVRTLEQFRAALPQYLSEEQQKYELVLRYKDDGDWVNFDKKEEFDDAVEILRHLQSKNPTSALSIQVELGAERQIPVIEEVPVKEEVVIEEKVEEVVDEVVDEVEKVEQAVQVEVTEPQVEESKLGQSFVVVEQEEKEVNEEEQLRQSLVAMRQSVQSFLQNAPVQPKPEPLPQSQFDQDVQEEVKSEPQVAVPEKFKHHIEQLSEMGFNDIEKNLVLLENKNGNLLEVVQELLQ